MISTDAAAGVRDPALRAVIADHWDYRMRWSPLWATTLGDHRFDDRLARRAAASIAAAAGERDALLARLAAIDAAGLGDADRTTLALLRGQLEAERAVDACRMHEWLVEAGGQSLFAELSFVVAVHPVATPRDAANLIARIEQGELLIDDAIANLAIGLAGGRVTSAEKARRAVAQLDAELARPVDDWTMVAPAWATPSGADPWPAGERERLAGALRQVVAAQIRPALVRLRDFLRDRVLPAARTDREGLVGLPDGERCYRAAIHRHLDAPASPDELHALGIAEIARTDRELAALGGAVLGACDLAATIARLRTDPALYFASREEILAAAHAALQRAKAAIADWFSVLPATDCVVREIPPYQAPYATVAYYQPPHGDGSKPGEYLVNTFRPETRPRFELEVLTWHESIPGHHLQVALAQELGALPAFRRHGGSTAFNEGWALYSEQLADEIGLYSSDLDRLGKLSHDAWRAARLVVDTGIHALGWSRARAEDFLGEHTALTIASIATEVDRYLQLPGQALAYRVGQRAILQLRAEARAALGAAFDRKRFHAVVLGAGAVTLPVLRERVDAWISSQLG